MNAMEIVAIERLAAKRERESIVRNFHLLILEGRQKAKRDSSSDKPLEILEKLADMIERGEL
jgi:hypothetical protein